MFQKKTWLKCWTDFVRCWWVSLKLNREPLGKEEKLGGETDEDNNVAKKNWDSGMDVSEGQGLICHLIAYLFYIIAVL